MEFSVGGFELGLLPNATPSITGAQALWGVTQTKAKLAHLFDLGATALEPVRGVVGDIKVAAMVDPYGNRLVLIEKSLARSQSLAVGLATASTGL